MASSSSQSIISAAVTVFVLLTVICIKTGVAQPSMPACISSLVPCAEYLNSTKPPVSCCNPLKEAVTHQLDCLCKLYENPDLLKSFQINVTKALALPGYCGIPGTVSACTKVSSSTNSSNQLPATVSPSGNKSNGGDHYSSYSFNVGFLQLFLVMLVGSSFMLW